MRYPPVSGGRLRNEISARNGLRAAEFFHETTFGSAPNVIYCEDGAGGHGNFLPAVYKRILANPNWRARLGKTYTSSARVPRANDRWRGELECAASSDALLMNIFCYPRILHRPGFRSLLGVDAGDKPEFGVRAYLPMRNGEVDRTELDLCLGPLLVEAKLTESGFGMAARERLLRYSEVGEVFALEDLAWTGGRVRGYQMIRGVLAAHRAGGRFALLCDARRADLVELWFQVLRAVTSAELRSRMALHSWQELSAASPAALQNFLAEKYGISPSG